MVSIQYWLPQINAGSRRLSSKSGLQIPERWYEFGFVVNNGSQKVYIQSAFSIHDEGKRQQGIFPLLKSGDSFRKLVVTSSHSKMHMDENGISYVGIIPFLLEDIDRLL